MLHGAVGGMEADTGAPFPRDVSVEDKERAEL